MPDATLDAFRNATEPAPKQFTVLDDIDGARADLGAPAESGVDLDEATSALEGEGVEQFADAYAQMLDAIARRRQRIARPCAAAMNQTPCLRASWLRARAISWGAVRLLNSAMRLPSRTDCR